MAKTQKEYVQVFSLNNTYGNATDNVKVAPPPLPDPNKVIHFETNFKKSDEEIVYSSKFNNDVETLLNNSETTRIAKTNKKKGIKRIPRPQNSWILYRRDKTKDPRFKKMKSSQISKIIGKMWKDESKDVKESYIALGRLSKEKHANDHKGYKFKPNKSKQKNPSKKSKGNKKEAKQKIPKEPKSNKKE